MIHQKIEKCSGFSNSVFILYTYINYFIENSFFTNDNAQATPVDKNVTLIPYLVKNNVFETEVGSAKNCCFTLSFSRWEFIFEFNALIWCFPSLKHLIFLLLKLIKLLELFVSFFLVLVRYQKLVLRVQIE